MLALPMLTRCTMRSYVAKLQAFYDEATTQVAAMEAALKDAKVSDSLRVLALNTPD